VVSEQWVSEQRSVSVNSKQLFPAY